MIAYNRVYIVLSLLDSIVKNRPSLDGIYVENFDGLRAVAALLVMSMHARTIPTFAGGAPGVWIFFALSGYLLYSGFLRYGGEIQTSGIFSYLARRVFRILPLYLFFAFIYAYVFKGWELDQKNAFFLVQLFFLKGVLHLWTVKTEMTLYLILPFLVFVLFFIRHDLGKAGLLVSLSLANVVLFDHYGFSLADTDAHLAIFMLGMAAVHLNRYVPLKVAPWLAYGSFGMILLLSTFAPWTYALRELFGVTSRVSMYGNTLVFYPLCFVLLVSLSRFKSRFWANRWLRLVGVCGFGFYLWHPMVIEIVREAGITGLRGQFCCYFFNFLLSVTTYWVIEKPGIELGRFVSRWIRNNAPLLPGIRPWSVCVILIMFFMCGRQYFLTNKDLLFEVNIKPPQDTIAKLFLSVDDQFIESVSSDVALAGGVWQTVRIPIRERVIDKIRFDPGGVDGRYLIREIKVHLPRSDRTESLDLQAFSALKDIRNLSVVNDVLIVDTEKNAIDPILVYGYPVPGNVIRWPILFFFFFCIGCALIFFSFLFLDKIYTLVMEKRCVTAAEL